MDVERIEGSGGWRISDIVGDQLVTLRFFGYTKTQAIMLFRQEMKTRKTCQP